MDPRRYFIPIMRDIPPMYSNPIINSNYLNFNGGNLLGRLSSSIKSLNWKGIFSGINKTLNTVNQTIPLVKQAKPMYDNVKSMMKLTKVFKTETKNNYRNFHYQKKQFKDNVSNIIPTNNENMPTFFI